MADKMDPNRTTGVAAPASTDRNRRLPSVWRLLLGAVLLYAAYDKILYPEDFARAVHNYRLLPAAAVNPVAVVLPWMELLLGFSLLTGVWLPGGALASTLLLAVFNGALIFNLARGLDVSCGCFSVRSVGATVTWWTVARDLLLLAAGLRLTVAVFASSPDDPEAS